MLSSLRQNLTYSLRTLLKNPGFTITAVLTLALGIGATTAIFSVVYAVFEPMPYPKPDQLVMVWSMAKGNRNSVALHSTSAPATGPNRSRALCARPDSSQWKACP